MSSPRTARARIASPGAGRFGRHLRVPTTSGIGADEGRGGRRELVVTLTGIVAVSAVVGGPWIWVVATLVLVGTILGTLQVLATLDGADPDLGVPLESLLVPSVAALGAVGVVRVVPLGLAIVPALALLGVLIDRAVAVETRIASNAQGPTEADRPRALAVFLVVAFVAFVGIAAIVPNGLAGTQLDGAPVPPLPIGDLVLLALADAVVAGLLGYRAAALRLSSARDAAWAAVTSAVVIALGAAAIRAMGIPRLIGPALLMVLLYLWDTVHAAPSSRRRDPRWIWETLALAALGIVVAVWNIRLIG
jgi:hypothetical protein